MSPHVQLMQSQYAPFLSYEVNSSLLGRDRDVSLDNGAKAFKHQLEAAAATPDVAVRGER